MNIRFLIFLTIFLGSFAIAVAKKSTVPTTPPDLTKGEQPSDKVTINLSRAHFWDITAVQALDRVVIKFRREGTEVEMVGLSEASATVVDRYAVHNDPEAVEKLMGGH
jgi:MFS superfamily sulfate permease-like transporter